jgi:hypothetical protein
MPPFLTDVLATPPVALSTVAMRLLTALLLGAAVAWTYRHTRDLRDTSPTFPGTLILLSVLIAMVTQVIGDNVARAFSLVGALSIVRFRTVVRDTQDTAFVIFAVVVGMAVGAGAPWVGVIGLVVIGLASFVMRPAPSEPGTSPTMTLALRVGLGLDLNTVLGDTLDTHLVSRHMHSVGTGKQGTSLDVLYDIVLKPGCSPDDLVKTLYAVDGVHAVELRRSSEEAS